MTPNYVEQARTLGEIAHRGQVDKLGEPYFNHPLAVADKLDPEDHLGRATAYLHDVLEDTDVTIPVLRWMGLPFAVVEAVQVLTHAPHEPNETYWLRIRLNPLALRVKAADIAHNLDPKRIEKLDARTAARLIAKYTRAREFLGLIESEN